MQVLDELHKMSLIQKDETDYPCRVSVHPQLITCGKQLILELQEEKVYQGDSWFCGAQRPLQVRPLNCAVECKWIGAPDN